MNFKEVLKIRLEIIRSVRAVKLDMLDRNINILEDEGLDATELRAHRKRLRDITEPYKALIDSDEEVVANEANNALSSQWDAFASVDWN